MSLECHGSLGCLLIQKPGASLDPGETVIYERRSRSLSIQILVFGCPGSFLGRGERFLDAHVRFFGRGKCFVDAQDRFFGRGKWCLDAQGRFWDGEDDFCRPGVFHMSLEPVSVNPCVNP